MPTIPCRQQECPPCSTDPGSPVANLSSEAPDVDLFIGYDWGFGLPPLGSTFYSVGCVGFATSSVSQEDADLQAAAQAVLCRSTNWPVWNGLTNLYDEPVYEDRPVFWNVAQYCDSNCADGTPFTYTAAAGIFANFNQNAANLAAYQYACAKAAQNRLCLTDPTATDGCIGELFTSVVVASAGHSPVTFSIVSGALPDGLGLSYADDTATISGTPVHGGDTSFTLRATDPGGNHSDKVITLSFFGMTNDTTLTAAVNGTPYSEFLVTDGGTAPIVFELLGGSLPDGLTLNASTGEISGTPTVDGLYAFVIRAISS